MQRSVHQVRTERVSAENPRELDVSFHQVGYACRRRDGLSPKGQSAGRQPGARLLRCNPALRSGRSKECPQDARYANCVGGGHDHIEDPFNKQFTAVGNGRKAEAEYDEKCRQRDYVDRR